ncbi:apolipoprotein D-like [Centruroides vittatus]|uniref:apolipoprotein D-like n=1 Tax=Centruroides vittatus TaxID=120091 RepID=UPI00350F7CC7
MERGVFASTLSANHYNRIALAKLNVRDRRQPAKMEFRMPGITEPIKYYIIDTDYDNYTLAWGCYEASNLRGTFGHFEYIWLLSRTPKMDTAIQQELYTLMDDRGIRRLRLTRNRMDNCEEKVN